MRRFLVAIYSLLFIVLSQLSLLWFLEYKLPSLRESDTKKAVNSLRAFYMEGKDIAENGLLDDVSIPLLSSSFPNDSSQYTYVQKTRGVVKSIDKYDNDLYASLALEDNKKKEILRTQIKVSDPHLYILKDNKKEPIQLNQLSVGDSLEYTLIYDFSKKESIFELIKK